MPEDVEPGADPEVLGRVVLARVVGPGHARPPEEAAARAAGIPPLELADAQGTVGQAVLEDELAALVLGVHRLHGQAVAQALGEVVQLAYEVLVRGGGRGRRAGGFRGGAGGLVVAGEGYARGLLDAEHAGVVAPGEGVAVMQEEAPAEDEDRLADLWVTGYVCG